MKMLERIRLLLEKRGVTQHQLEKLAALPTNRVSKWMAGQGEPTARQAARIAALLDVPLDWLVSEQEDSVADPPAYGYRLNYGERLILDVVRALGLSRDESIRRLSVSSDAGRRSGGSAAG